MFICLLQTYVLACVAVKTALTGSSSYFDIMSLHKACISSSPLSTSMMATYRTLSYWQTRYRMGIFKILLSLQFIHEPVLQRYNTLHNYPLFVTGARATLLYLLCPLLTIIVLVLLGTIRDWWALGVLEMVMLSRLINVVVIKRRSYEVGWKGKKVQGAYGDLLVVPSQDRAGQWLRDETSEESFAIGFATLLVYASAALAGNASTVGNLHILCLLLSSAALLSLCNSSTQ
ncbi:hypothetical protein ARMSODRAFT_1027036 [Armillaria solidipes]|uniref:Uncharacterized protein n=1 Tax=Armillaria solidipes TaxID=1076256 RepID=A0A2H3B5N7_9AGAR|nr:hypothetical protein ARMSODRAFT_1027036 [Armillaria solidipes]